MFVLDIFKSNFVNIFLEEEEVGRIIRVLFEILVIRCIFLLVLCIFVLVDCGFVVFGDVGVFRGRRLIEEEIRKF